MRSDTKQLLTAAEKHIHRMFLAGMIFAAISCFARSDFNMPLFGFLYLMWDKDDVSRVDLIILRRTTSLRFSCLPQSQYWQMSSGCFTMCLSG